MFFKGAFIGHHAKIVKILVYFLTISMTIDHHALLSLVISILNAQNGIRFIKIMQLDKLCRLIQQLHVTVS